MLEFHTVEVKYNVLKKSQSLKGWKENRDSSLGTKDVYLNIDETPLTRKENARLRKERNRLRILEENKDKRIFLTKGVLKVDDNIVDRFNIDNQLLVM